MSRFDWSNWICQSLTRTFSANTPVRRRPNSTNSVEQLESRTLLAGNAPVIPSGQVFTLLSNSDFGFAVGTVTATDTEALSYSIIGGNNGAFDINPSTGQLRIASKPLFDALNPSTILSIQATETIAPTQSTIGNVTVNINYLPILNDVTFDVLSTITTGATIGTIAATDANITSTLTYSLASTADADAFTLNATSGVLKVANKAAFDALVFPKQLAVQVRDNGTPQGVDTAIITINRNSPPVVNDQQFTVLVTAPQGSVIGTVAVTHADSGQQLTYSIITGNETGALAIDGGGQLTISNKLAFDALPISLMFTVDVRDNGAPQGIDTALITLNRNTPPVINDQVFAAPQKIAVGAEVGVVAAFDAETSTGQTLSFKFNAGNETGAFALDTVTGKLTIANVAAFNSLAFPKQLTIQVQDSASPPSTKSATITISKNHAPELLPTTLIVPVTGSTLGTLVATDSDIGQVLSYQITSPGATGIIEIDAATGTVTIVDQAKFEKLSFPVKLEVTVRDNGSPSASTVAEVTIARSPTGALSNIQFDSQTFTVPTTVLANNPLGTVFAYGKVTQVVDPPPLRFALANPLSDAAKFSIDSVTGVLTSLTALSNVGSTTIQVTASVLGNPGLSVTRPVTINVVDTKNHLPTAQNLDVTIEENSSPRTTVGKIIAHPSDSGEKLTFTIVDTSLPRAFTIDSKTGDITINDDSLLDYEKVHFIYLKVRVTDDGKGFVDTPGATEKAKPLSTFVTVIIRLDNIDPEPFKFDLRDDSRTYHVGDNPVRLDPEAVFRLGTVTEKLDKATLSILVTGPKTTRDSITVVSDTVGPGNISVVGKSILYGNTVIGMFTKGKNTGKSKGGNGDVEPNLKITFNSAATAAAVQALLRRIGFKTGGPAGERHVSLTFSQIPLNPATPPDISVTPVPQSVIVNVIK